MFVFMLCIYSDAYGGKLRTFHDTVILCDACGVP